MANLSRLKSALRPVAKVAKVVSPTGIGVLLSVGAHAAFLAFGPRANFSFAALTEAAQQADAEETIVPIVQLTPAERNRLPGFAQPRSQAATNGLGSLSLPSGLPSIPNTSVPRRRTVTAAPFPSATLPQPPRRALPSLSSALPSVVPNTRRPSISSLRINPQPPSVSVITPPPEPAVRVPSVSVPSEPSGEGDAPETSDSASSSPAGTATDLLPQVDGLSLDEALARAQATEGPEESAAGTDSGPDGAGEGEQAVTPIPVEGADAIAIAPAQGDPAQLLEGYTYDDTDVSVDEAEANAAEWLALTAQGKSEIATDSAELTIDSQFRVCQENPPVPGLIGVVVNPDGSQEDAQVLKSIGYDLLNRQALDAVEYSDFGQPEVPTQYQVAIDVIYEPEGCVQVLPEEEPAAPEAEPVE